MGAHLAWKAQAAEPCARITHTGTVGLVGGGALQQGVTVDRDGVIRHWSAEWEDTVGYTAAEAVGRRVDVVVPPPLRSRHWRGFNKAMETGQMKRGGKPFTTVALHKTGKLVPLRATLELIHADDGSPTGAKGTILGPGPAWMGPVAQLVFAAMTLGKRRNRRTQAR